MPIPKHKHEITIALGSNSFPDLLAALRQVVDELRETGNKTVSGSPSWAGYWHHDVLPEQTQEKYAAELETYLANLPQDAF